MIIRMYSLFILAWSLWITDVSGSDCSTVFLNTPTFQDCQYRCHCKNDVQCDETTGECNNGCDFGWMGPGCQYRNIAKDYSRAQNVGGTHIHADFAITAVDGDVTTCARTDGQPPNNYHYWRIEWTRDYRIVGLVVKIQPGDVNNFPKFRVETGPNNDDFNSVCYQHGDTPGTPAMEIMCRQPVWTRHLRIILDRPNTRLRVCEVEIYGGRDVTFNKPTNQTSTYQISFSSLSVDGQPHVSGLTAVDTCSTTEYGHNNPYWLVDFLADYVVQSVYFYGRLSNYEQYSGFQLSVLNTGANEILLYTDPGNIDVNQYQPKVIDVDKTRLVTSRYLKVLRPHDNTLLTVCEIVTFAECPMNRCSWDCTTDCHCDAETTGSYQKDGDCPYGCSGRWTGLNRKCNIECYVTEWGNQCQNTCGYCHRAEPCNVVTGHCEHGCNGPWYTPECTQECSNKKYGINCSQTCGHCKNDLQCNITSGHCVEGCVSGWQPPLCQEACTPGSYGDGCTTECGKCLDTTTCRPGTGVCEHGCDPGYRTDLCNEMCIDGTYGSMCSNTCGNCAGASTCNAITGQCPGKCQPGFQGTLCNTACTYGEYGENCAETCGYCKDITDCHKETGYCSNGCQENWKGVRCKISANLIYHLRDNLTTTMSSISNGLMPEYAINVWNGTRDPDTCQCCSGTKNAQISWWKLDLQHVYPLKKLHIYGAENERVLNQLSGFSVYLANGTIEEGALVYTDNSSTEDDSVKYNIPLSNRLAQVVTIQRFGTLTLCNMSLIDGECSTGYYGDHCTKLCYCADLKSCDRYSGHCQSSVCKLGWTGSSCNTECPFQTFGEGCDNECFCKHNTCTKDYGICSGECQAGFKGVHCNEACTSGTFGEGCVQVCHCTNTTCTTDDGICPGECMEGFEGKHCDKEVIPGDISKIAGIIGGCLGAVTIVVILIAVFIHRYRIYKREQHIRKNYATPDQCAVQSNEMIYDTIDADEGISQTRRDTTM